MPKSELDLIRLSTADWRHSFITKNAAVYGMPAIVFTLTKVAELETSSKNPVEMVKKMLAEIEKYKGLLNQRDPKFKEKLIQLQKFEQTAKNALAALPKLRGVPFAEMFNNLRSQFSNLLLKLNTDIMKHEKNTLEE
jgi:hypothetical protein